MCTLMNNTPDERIEIIKDLSGSIMLELVNSYKEGDIDYDYLYKITEKITDIESKLEQDASNADDVFNDLINIEKSIKKV